MLELIKEFLLFGIVEDLVLVCWFKWICKVKNVKYWHALLFIIPSILVGFLNIPYTKQLFACLFLVVYLIFINKGFNKFYIKYVLSAMIYLLISESIICIPLDIFKIVDLSIYDKDLK